MASPGIQLAQCWFPGREPTLCQLYPVASLPALGPWAPPAERGPSLESIYRASLTVDLCGGNKISSLKKIFYYSQLGPLKKKKNPGALDTCPVCPLVKTALVVSAHFSLLA